MVCAYLPDADQNQWNWNSYRGEMDENHYFLKADQIAKPYDALGDEKRNSEHYKLEERKRVAAEMQRGEGSGSKGVSRIYNALFLQLSRLTYRAEVSLF